MEPLQAAAWLEGFLNRNAMVLLHDQQLWQLVNDWLCGLSEAHFTHILPLVRGTDPARCIRCPKPGTHHCGFEYVSTWHPGATLCLTFSLCQVHAAAEYGVQA